MWGSNLKEQEVRQRQDRQAQEARETELAQRQAQYRQQLLRQADAFRSLASDPRHTLYVELLKEARRAFRAHLKRIMEQTVEPSHPAQAAWLMGRIELLTDLLEAPEHVAQALEDQRRAQDNGAA